MEIFESKSEKKEEKKLNESEIKTLISSSVTIKICREPDWEP